MKHKGGEREDIIRRIAKTMISKTQLKAHSLAMCCGALDTPVTFRYFAPDREVCFMCRHLE